MKVTLLIGRLVWDMVALGYTFFQLCNFLYEALLENASSYILYTE